METQPSRVWLSSMALLVGAVVSCTSTSGGSGQPPVHPPFDAEGTNAILVGPGAQDVSIANAFLWPDRGDVTVWVAIDPKSTLYIDFTEEIFEGMTQPSPGVYRVNCVGARCDSGKVKAGVAHKAYVYMQTILAASKADKADGRIIIKP
jgi:hypothetical protein